MVCLVCDQYGQDHLWGVFIPGGDNCRERLLIWLENACHWALGFTRLSLWASWRDNQSSIMSILNWTVIRFDFAKIFREETKKEQKKLITIKWGNSTSWGLLTKRRRLIEVSLSFVMSLGRCCPSTLGAVLYCLYKITETVPHFTANRCWWKSGFHTSVGAGLFSLLRMRREFHTFW